MNNKIGLGGGCHWCTEGVFQSLIGVKEVKQGWICSEGENKSFSEAVIVEFNSAVISLKDLIEIHLYTHACTSNHSFRKKYRSAIYIFDEQQKLNVEYIITEIQLDFDDKIITQVLSYNDFKLNKEKLLNYFYTRIDNSFCENYIHPKLALILSKFSNKVNPNKIAELKRNNVQL